MIRLNKHAISASIKDRYANIVYLFHFENTNKYGSNELKFEITIDPKAFISKFKANIDGQLFIGKTKEKEIASKEYCAAKKKNENAILICQPHENISNVFEIKTNIDSQSKILLKIEIEQYLQKMFGCNVLHIEILKNFNKYNIKENIDSISFKLNIEDKSGIYDVNIPMINDIDTNIMDKISTKCEIRGKITNKSSMNELVLTYKIKGELNESYILFDNNSNTFCHIISDIITDSIMDEKDIDDIDEGQNNKIENNILIPRRVIFVIDRSGSMSGSKWNKTIYATIMAIKQLRNGYDRFSIILFDDNIQLLPYQDIKGCILADDENKSHSIQILQNKQVGGSTNINDSLLKAMEIIKIDILLLNNDSNYKYNFFMNQIMFITDGEPNNGESNTMKIIQNVKIANDLSKIDKYNNKISIFSFGIGCDSNDSEWINDLNHSFLKSLSVNNNGFYRRIKQSSTDTALCQYFNILCKPILSNINIKYKNKNIQQLTNTHFNTLYTGNDLIICGKIENTKNIKNTDWNLLCKISAISGKKIKQNNKLIIKPITILKKMKININTKNKNKNTERIWGYLKLQQFATQKLINNDMIEIDDDEKKENSSLPLSLALKYKFVTPWTSMIVVKENKEKTDLTEQQQIHCQSLSLQQKIDAQILLLESAAFKADAFQNELENDLVDAEDGLSGLKAMSNMRIKKIQKKNNKGFTSEHPYFYVKGNKIKSWKRKNKCSIQEYLNKRYIKIKVPQWDDIEHGVTHIDLSKAPSFQLTIIKELLSISGLHLFPEPKPKKRIKKKNRNKGKSKHKKAMNDDNHNLLKRLNEELTELKCNAPSNCSLGPIGDDITIWKATINGAKDSPYKDGVFHLEIKIPTKYPLQAPKCRFITKIYHCNINENGEINLDLLKNKWSPSLTIIKLLMAIISLLSNPNVDDVLMTDIAKLYKNNKKKHDKKARQWTQKYAK